MSTPKKPQPTFDVVVVGPDLAPERLPVRLLADILSAIQKLATGVAKQKSSSSHGGGLDEPHGIGLISVLRGSVRLPCVAFDPDVAISRIRAIGSVLSGSGEELPDGDGYADLKAVETIANAARQIGGKIYVTRPGNRRNPIFSADATSHEVIEQRLIVSGQTSIYAEVLRVGGATGLRCSIRPVDGEGIVYCSVATRDLSRKLGDQLFQRVIVHGTARWLTRTWRLVGLQIQSVTIPNVRTLSESAAAIIKANDAAWSEVEDPQSLLGD
jgi:hypothetical protein